MSALESRYRRLLALYPAGHRERYQMEMLGTLMDGAADGQRAPRLREAFDLFWSAIWLRLNRDGGRPGADSRWAKAAAIFGPLGALTIAALYVHLPLGNLGWQQRTGDAAPPWAFDVSPIPFIQGGAWLLIAVIALAGRRRIAATLAWLTVAGTLAWSLREYRLDPTALVKEWPLLVFGVTVAASLLLARGPVALRRLSLGLFGGTAAACAAALWLDAMIARVEIHDDGGGMGVGHWGMNFPSVPGIDTVGLLPILLYLAFLVVTGWILARAGAGLRRRLLAYAAVPVLTYVSLQWMYSFYVLNTMRQWEQKVPLTVGQWAGLLLIPPVIFAVAVIVVRRKDSQQRLIELGRAHS